MLLLTLAGLNAVHTQNARYAWLTTGTPSSGTIAHTDGDSAALWWSLHADTFDGKTIGRVDVAAIGPDSPVPPGIPRLPGPGEYYASPAMAKLLATTPASQSATAIPAGWSARSVMPRCPRRTRCSS